MIMNLLDTWVMLCSTCDKTQRKRRAQLTDQVSCATGPTEISYLETHKLEKHVIGETEKSYGLVR